MGTFDRRRGLAGPAACRCGDRTPRSFTSVAASILNSRLSFRLVMYTLRFLGHDQIYLPTKPAAGQALGLASQFRNGRGEVLEADICLEMAQPRLRAGFSIALSLHPRNAATAR